MHRLPREFYARDPVVVAQELLGKFLVHNRGGVERVGRIVEVEAYLGPHDLAAHSSKGLTPRTRALFGPPGHAYIYLIYGMYHCMNTVTGNGSGVLLRALEPTRGLEPMAARRGLADPRTLCSGPGKLAQALGVDASFNGLSLLDPPFRLEAAPAGIAVATGLRIGITKAVEQPWRFGLKGSPFLSRRL